MPEPDSTPAPRDPHHFEFDLDRAIRGQVVEALEQSPALPLTVDVGPKASGIYASQKALLEQQSIARAVLIALAANAVFGGQ